MESAKGSLIALIGGTLLAGAALASPFGLKGFDGWSADEMSVLSSMRLSELAPAPADPSNGHESSSTAVGLGQRIFFDQCFSGNDAFSCARCHQPDR